VSGAVLDASALLAFLQGETGADSVEEQLGAGSSCGAANWSEIAQKVIAAGRDWDLARALLVSYELVVEPVTVDDAEWAAGRWRRGEGLSLADRLCLALGARLEVDTWTADATWGTTDGIHQIR
jgi:PIN domain nuclease of toxin-antitoxin system